jgi:flagella basal body P-ring formation protein FlgA
MRCSRRSTSSRGRRALAFGAVVALATLGAGAQADPVEPAVRAAIQAAVAERFGGEAAVSVSDLRVSLHAAGSVDRLSATPEPGARSGVPARFYLRGPGGRRIGEAGCVVRVATPHLRTTRAIPRGRALAGDDVEVARGDLGIAPLGQVPLDVARARAARDLAAGDIVLASALVIAPLVRSGDEVITIVRLPGLEARGRAVASQSGHAGDVIRIVNPESGRPMKARVIGHGEVEVVHGS